MKLINSLSLSLNICKFRIISFFDKHLKNKEVYPIKILPKENFTLSINIGTLKDNCNLYITRRIDSDLDLSEITLNNNSFKDLIWKQEKPQNMSWNLLGKYFLPKYNRYIPNKFGSMDWQGCDTIMPYLTRGQFHTEIKHYNAFIPLAKIHGIKFPISLEGKPQRDFLQKTQIEPKPIIINGSISVRGELLIEHRPTNFNYWHVQFLMIDHETVPMKPNISSSKIKTFLREDILGRFAKSKMIFENCDIPSHFFIKSSA